MNSIQTTKLAICTLVIPIVVIGLAGCNSEPGKPTIENHQPKETELTNSLPSNNEHIKKKYPPHSEYQGWYNIPVDPDDDPSEFHQTQAQIPPLDEAEIHEMNAAVRKCIFDNCIRLGWNEEDFKSYNIDGDLMADVDIEDRTLQAIVPTPEHLTKELFRDLQELVKKNRLWRVMLRANEIPYLIYPEIIYVQHTEATDLEAQLQAAVQMEIDLVEPKESVFRRKAAYLQRELKRMPEIKPEECRIFAFDNFRGDPEFVEVWLLFNRKWGILFGVSHPKPDSTSTSWATKNGRVGAQFLHIAKYDIRIFIYNRNNFKSKIKVERLVRPGEFEEFEYEIDRVIADKDLMGLDPGRSNKGADHF